jgi:large subunit ribosomal protein L14
MILKGTYLIPIDKNGVWWVSVFHLYNGFFRKFCKVGGFVKTSVKILKTNIWLLKKSKINAIIIHSRYQIKKSDNSYLYFKNNSCILLKKRLYPVGKEILGPGVFSLKRKKFLYSFAGII